MANGQSRVGIGSFLEELQSTIGDNTQTPEEPEESLLETITKPRYEVPGLSTYSRVVGKLSKILNASIDKGDIKPFVDPIYGTHQEPVRDLPSLIAPMSGDPETGKYSYLDIAFGGLEGAVGLKAVSKGITGVRRSAGKIPPMHVFEDGSSLTSQDMTRMNELITDINRRGGIQETNIQDIERALDDLSPDAREAFEDTFEDALYGAREATDDISDVSRLRSAISEGTFKSSKIPELEDLEVIAHSELRMKKGVEILPADQSHKNLDILNLPEDVGIIVQRRQSLGHGRDRNLIIGRTEFGRSSRIKIYSADANTNKLVSHFEFKLENYDDTVFSFTKNVDETLKGKKIVSGIHFFEDVYGEGAVTHSGLLLRDFMDYAIDNDWVVKETSMTMDSLYAMLNQAIRRKAEIIFSTEKRVKSQKMSHSKWSRMTKKFFVDEKGDFVKEGIDDVMKDLEEFVDRASKGKISRQEGKIVGRPKPKLTESKDYGNVEITQEAKAKIKSDLQDKYPELSHSELVEKVEREIIHTKALVPSRKIHDEFEYSAITIKKLAGAVSMFLGMSTDEFLEFLSYDPDSMESQVFDNEISF